MRKLSLFLLLLFVVLACKKSVEGETATWESNKTKLKKLKASYPSFATLLDKELKDAETKWKEAQGISNEEEKIKKMAEANYTFSQGFVYELGSLENKMEILSRKAKELSNSITAKDVNLSKSDLKIVIATNDKVKETLLQVEKLLNKGVKSEDKAYLSIKDANKSLADSEIQLNDAMQIINANRENKKNAKNEPSTDKKEDNGKTENKDTSAVKKKKKKTPTE
ncbi:MAG: hypothetical protein OHK0045_07600 [Raineya sp.]